MNNITVKHVNAFKCKLFFVSAIYKKKKKIVIVLHRIFQNCRDAFLKYTYTQNLTVFKAKVYVDK